MLGNGRVKFGCRICNEKQARVTRAGSYDILFPLTHQHHHLHHLATV